MLTLREVKLALATGVVALAGLTWAGLRDRITEWGDLADERDELQLTIEKFEARISRKEGYQRRIETIKLILPEYPKGRDVKSQLLQQLQALASRHALSLPAMEPDREREVGEMGLYRLGVSDNWVGNLEQLTRFLFDMQQQGAVIDVRQMTVKADDRGALRGNMRIDFAYNRVDPSKMVAASPPSAPPPASTLTVTALPIADVPPNPPAPAPSDIQPPPLEAPVPNAPSIMEPANPTEPLDTIPPAPTAQQPLSPAPENPRASPSAIPATPRTLPPSLPASLPPAPRPNAPTPINPTPAE